MNDDLISRQAAIDALEELKELDYELYVRMGCCHLLEDDWDYVIRRYKEIIKETPSIQPKTGRWIPIKPLLTAVRCSECKRAFAEKTNFCPHCGAKMKGETE